MIFFLIPLNEMSSLVKRSNQANNCGFKIKMHVVVILKTQSITSENKHG